MSKAKLDNLIDRYCACWTVMDEEARYIELESILTADVRYVDPTVDLAGPRALAQHIMRVTALRPAARIERVGNADHHHDLARFAWHLRDGDEIKMASSIDIVMLDGTGLRFRQIIGFFGAIRPSASRGDDATGRNGVR